jgi:hypothetical protein
MWMATDTAALWLALSAAVGTALLCGPWVGAATGCAVYLVSADRPGDDESPDADSDAA